MQAALATEAHRPRRHYEASWMFEIGQAVSAAELRAIVLSRGRTAMGREFYRIWVMGSAYGRPYRVILASGLR